MFVIAAKVVFGAGRIVVSMRFVMIKIVLEMVSVLTEVVAVNLVILDLLVLNLFATG